MQIDRQAYKQNAKVGHMCRVDNVTYGLHALFFSDLSTAME